jgi:hypothetical protein
MVTLSTGLPFEPSNPTLGREVITASSKASGVLRAYAPEKFLRRKSDERLGSNLPNGMDESFHSLTAPDANSRASFPT